MTKLIPVLPDELRKPGWIKLNDIPVNQYARPVAEEVASGTFSKPDLLRIYRDMRLIREFESMLYSIKTTSMYNGLEYNNPGPAHLSMGQEASSVGQAYLLSPDDFIFGSHRSHGEILAKGLSAIHQLPEPALLSIMENYLDGAIWRVIEKAGRSQEQDVRRMAADFLVYGALAEIFAKTTGFNKGLGGSMHAFFPPFGIYPNNAIVGGSGDISVGAALYKKINRKPGVVVCNIGDGSLGCGPV
jgi:2-oxoisovalerate dehydrogenase E1 component